MHPSARRPFFVAALAAAAVTGAVAASAALLPVAQVRADDVDDSLAQLKELVKAGDEGKIIAKITEIEGKLDERITTALSDIARTAKSDRVSKTAMKVAAQRKDPSLLKWLKGKADDKKMAEDHPERYLAVLDSLSFYGDKSTMKPLEDVVKKYLPMNADISKRAIAAYGSIREKPVVDQLLEWLEQTEKTGSAGQGGGGGGKSMSKETRECYDQAKGAVLKTLERLTMQDMADHASWSKWWKENQKTFEFPDPNAPEPDFATLPAFTDRAYGFTITKPEGKFWSFIKSEINGGRVTLTNRDAEGMLWARMNAIVWKGNKDVASVEQFAKYYETLFRDKEFEQFGKDGEPAIAEKKIGGRDFHVVGARGMGKGDWKAWESCERRVYITMANPGLFLYIECAIRSGADDATKAAFWGAVEGMTFKK